MRLEPKRCRKETAPQRASVGSGSRTPSRRELVAPLLSWTLPFLIVVAWEQMHGNAADERGLLLEMAERSAADRSVASAAKQLKMSRASSYRPPRPD